MAIMPLLLAGICYLAWKAIAIKKKIEHWKNRATSSLIILLFLVHPNLTEYFFGVFNCYNVDGTERVKSDLQVVCY